MKEREQFGGPLAEAQGLQWMLADMAIGLESSRTTIHKAASSRGLDGSAFPDATMAAMAKILSAETGLKVTSDALQLFGARGYSRNMPLERMLRDIRMFTIAGETAQVLRTLALPRSYQMSCHRRAAVTRIVPSRALRRIERERSSNMTRPADLLARRLHDAGCRHAFGMPGGDVLTRIDACALECVAFVAVARGVLMPELYIC